MLLFRQTLTSRQASTEEKCTAEAHRVSSAITNWIFMADVYMATPAVFKTPIVNVTHSERRHIAAFLMRGICERVLCAKLTMRWAKTRGQRKIERIVSGREKEKKEEMKARIASSWQSRCVPRWVTVLWCVNRASSIVKKKKKERKKSVCNSGKSLCLPVLKRAICPQFSQPDNNIECNVACDVIIRN